jgi:hypothetical protein
MEIAAIEGSYASVIGGAPAAATVFARDVKIRTDKDAAGPGGAGCRGGRQGSGGRTAARQGRCRGRRRALGEAR